MKEESAGRSADKEGGRRVQRKHYKQTQRDMPEPQKPGKMVRPGGSHSKLTNQKQKVELTVHRDARMKANQKNKDFLIRYLKVFG